MRHANHRPTRCDFPFRIPTCIFSSGAQSGQLTPALRHSANTQPRFWRTSLFFFTICTILTVTASTFVFNAKHAGCRFLFATTSYRIINRVQMYAILLVPFKSETFGDNRQNCNNCTSGFCSLNLNRFLVFICVD